MDRDRRRYWGEYARDLADRMELRDWTVNIVNEPPGHDEWGASAECRYGRKFVNIRFCNSFDEWEPDNQRSTLTHELIHCHFAGITQYLSDARGNVGKTWVSQLESVIVNQLEYGIDALADALAKSMPLPPTAPKKAKKKAKKPKATSNDHERTNA